MTKLQQLKEEARKEFDEKFSIGTGRKWIMTEEEAHEVKAFIYSLITKAYEAGKQAKAEEVKEIIESVQIAMKK